MGKPIQYESARNKKKKNIHTKRKEERDEKDGGSGRKTESAI